MPVGVYIRTAKHRSNMSKAMVAHFCSKEARFSMSTKLMGHPCSNETRTKISNANSGRVITKEHAAKISSALKGRIFSPSHRVKLSLAGKGKILSEEHKAKLRTYRIGVSSSKETRIKLSKAGKRNWNDLHYKENQLKAQRLALLIHPNKPEVIIMGMLESICPNEFKFVGDGQVIIAGKIPDFININGRKQIIECFGDYWHGERARCFEETEEGRIKLFKEYGFDTLIIWEGELKVPEKVINKIANFIKGGK